MFEWKSENDTTLGDSFQTSKPAIVARNHGSEPWTCFYAVRPICARQSIKLRTALRHGRWVYVYSSDAPHLCSRSRHLLRSMPTRPFLSRPVRPRGAHAVASVFPSPRQPFSPPTLTALPPSCAVARVTPPPLRASAPPHLSASAPLHPFLAGAPCLTARPRISRY